MAHTQKIATCCYCGTRAALVLRGKTRHELSCASCGAPLHELKMLRADAVSHQYPTKTTRRNTGARVKRSVKSTRSRRRGQSLARRFMRELWDVADDLLDDVFDVFD